MLGVSSGSFIFSSVSDIVGKNLVELSLRFSLYSTMKQRNSINSSHMSLTDTSTLAALWFAAPVVQNAV